MFYIVINVVTLTFFRRKKYFNGHGKKDKYQNENLVVFFCAKNRTDIVFSGIDP